VEAAKHRWRLSRKDGKCTLIGGTEKKGWFTVTVLDDELEDNQLAAKNCPVKIIRIEVL
jgi:ferredoxin